MVVMMIDVIVNWGSDGDVVVMVQGSNDSNAHGANSNESDVVNLSYEMYIMKCKGMATKILIVKEAGKQYFEVCYKFFNICFTLGDNLTQINKLSPILD